MTCSTDLFSYAGVESTDTAYGPVASAESISMALQIIKTSEDPYSDLFGGQVVPTANASGILSLDPSITASEEATPLESQTISGIEENGSIAPSSTTQDVEMPQATITSGEALTEASATTTLTSTITITVTDMSCGDKEPQALMNSSMSQVNDGISTLEIPPHTISPTYTSSPQRNVSGLLNSSIVEFSNGGPTKATSASGTIIWVMLTLIVMGVWVL